MAHRRNSSSTCRHTALSSSQLCIIGLLAQRTACRSRHLRGCTSLAHACSDALGCQLLHCAGLRKRRLGHGFSTSRSGVSGSSTRTAAPVRRYIEFCQNNSQLRAELLIVLLVHCAQAGEVCKRTGRIRAPEQHVLPVLQNCGW